MEPKRTNGIQPIDRITQDRMPQLRQMGSELVGSSGDWTHPQFCGQLEQGMGSPQGDGQAALRMGPIARRITLQPGQTVLDPPASLQSTRHFRFVELVHTAPGEQLAAPPQTVLAARQQDQAGGITIKAMHQMQAWFKASHPSDQGVLQLGTSPGLTQKTGGFEHHEEPSIPIQNRDRVIDQVGMRSACGTESQPDPEAKPAPGGPPPPHGADRCDTDSGPGRHPAEDVVPHPYRN